MNAIFPGDPYGDLDAGKEGPAAAGARSAPVVILLAMPLIFIIVLGVAVGEDFGKRDKLQVTVLNLDEGLPKSFPRGFPNEPWSAIVLRDLTETADIQVELVPFTDPKKGLEEADQLVKTGRRAAVLVLGPDFSKCVQRAPSWPRAGKTCSPWPRPTRSRAGRLSWP